MGLRFVFGIILYALLLSGCALDATLSSLMEEKAPQVFEDYNLQKAPFVRRSDQYY